MTPPNTLNIGPQSLADREPGDPVVDEKLDSQQLILAHAAERERMGRVLAVPPDIGASTILNEDLSELEEVVGIEVEGASVRGTDRHTEKEVVYIVRPDGPMGRSTKRSIPLSQLPESVKRIDAAREKAAKLEQVVDEQQAAAVAAAQGGKAAQLEAENAKLRAQLAEAENARLKAELAAAQGAADPAPAAIADPASEPGGVGPVAAGEEFPPVEQDKTPPAPSPDEGAAADKPEAEKPKAKRRAARKPASSKP